MKNIFPLANIVSEEYDANPDIDDGHYWIIDPIDGTTNLIHNYPHYCTSITLIKNYEPIIGITYNPITKDLFRAQKGKGAFLNDKRINVSKNDIFQRVNSEKIKKTPVDLKNVYTILIDKDDNFWVILKNNRLLFCVMH